ncbi:hypothetical protein LAUMK41_04148 [Mycobacterium attenuatum]|nr:hypothetical protein LAUMK41_04148 [Mycobacterium attenuatum]
MARDPAPALDPSRRSSVRTQPDSRNRQTSGHRYRSPADVLVERDVEVITRDGTVLRVNVFRHGETARPVMVSIHPYGTDDLSSRPRSRWTVPRFYRMLRQPKPVTLPARTGWEAPDPAWWTAHGFVVVNADSRGCGHSNGTGSLLSRQEAEDTYDLVQWVADQPGSDGRVVMHGVSYLATSQCVVAALQLPALRRSAPGRASPMPTVIWRFQGESVSRASSGFGQATCAVPARLTTRNRCRPIIRCVMTYGAQSFPIYRRSRCRCWSVVVPAQPAHGSIPGRLS